MVIALDLLALLLALLSLGHLLASLLRPERF